MSAADAPRDLAWAVEWANRRLGATGTMPQYFEHEDADALRLLLGAAEDAGRAHAAFLEYVQQDNGCVADGRCVGIQRCGCAEEVRIAIDAARAGAGEATR